MAGCPNMAAAGDSSRWEFERMDGELDAALVFAAGAGQAFQNGKEDFANSCLADAEDGYQKVFAALPTAGLSGSQLQELTAKLLRLRQVLDGLRRPIRNEAA